MNLKKYQKQLNPDPKFKKELWQRLESKMQTEKLSIFAWYQQRWFRYSAVMAVVVLVIGSGSTGAYAYVSPQVHEGSVLYPVKQTLEKIEEKIKRSPEAKAKFYIKQVNKREAEMKVMIALKKNTTNVQKKIQVIDKNIEKVSIWMEQNQIKNLKIQALVKKRLEIQKDRLELQKKILNNREQKLNNLQEIIKDPVKREIIKQRVVDELIKRRNNQFNTSTRPLLKDVIKKALPVLKSKVNSKPANTTLIPTRLKVARPFVKETMLNKKVVIPKTDKKVECNECDINVYKDNSKSAIVSSSLYNSKNNLKNAVLPLTDTSTPKIQVEDKTTSLDSSGSNESISASKPISSNTGGGTSSGGGGMTSGSSGSAGSGGGSVSIGGVK